MIFKGIQKTSFIDFPDRLATVLFTGGCNFECPYCHNSHLLKNHWEEYSEKTVLDFLIGRKNLINAVVISGGEPTLYSNSLIQFITLLKNEGFEIKLDTNGTFPEVLKVLLKNNLLDYVAMDIKAPLDKYRQVTQSESVDSSVIKTSINLIKNAGLSYEFRTTVCQELLLEEDIEEIIKQISPCEKYYLQNYRDGDNVLIGKGKLSPALYLDKFKNINFIEIR